MKKIIAVLFAAVLVLALWLAAGNARASRREAECERAWTAAFGSRDDSLKKHPKRETNATAKALEPLAKSLGIDLAPLAPGAPRLPTPADTAVPAVGAFVSAEIVKPEATIGAPSEELVRFLDASRHDLDAIEGLLVAGPAPEWSVDLSLPEKDRRSPNLLGQMRLQRVLMARALVSAREGRHDVAARSLEASWSLNDSLRGRPETVSVLIAMAVSRLEVAVLRKVSVDAGTWKERLERLDYRSALVETMALESRSDLPRASRRGPARGRRSWRRRLEGLVGSPWERLANVEFSESLRAFLTGIREAPLTDRPGEPTVPDARGAGSVAATIAIPNLRNGFLRADRFRVDAELTVRVLEASRLRRAGGRWPASIPGVESSRFPGASWRYEVTPDGRMSLSFSRELESPYAKGGTPLPLRFTSRGESG